ncbi:MAG: flagellar basal body rod protein FlgC, partial [Rhodospirillales bacterium]|nr:flagellar basal body rod protein FlgC [Rhodospirillales bacterium]
MDLVKALNVSASGLKAQGTRLRVIAENIANADSTAQQPGAEPYRRRVVTFGNVLDRELGAETVRVDGIVPDRSEFRRRFEPGHPAADDKGYVLTPNVNSLLEVADMR